MRLPHTSRLLAETDLLACEWEIPLEVLTDLTFEKEDVDEDFTSDLVFLTGDFLAVLFVLLMDGLVDAVIAPLYQFEEKFELENICKKYAK